MRATLLLLLCLFTLPAWAATSSVACSATPVVLSEQNTARKLLIVYNDDTKNLRAKMGSTSSATSFTVLIPPGGYWEMPPLTNGGYYIGVISGIWEADCTGAARVTEN